MDGDDTGPEPFLSAVVSFKGRFFFFFLRISFMKEYGKQLWIKQPPVVFVSVLTNGISIFYIDMGLCYGIMKARNMLL